ncbi:hypothetical protein COS78_03490, partial [Candidatus Shapirobacteria bacterium CG06_land_8_20_14_3_00_40_12]
KDLHLNKLLGFDFASFAKNLVNKDKIVEATYFIGAVKTNGSEKTQRLFNDQRKLLAHLSKNKFKYSLGYLMKSGGVFREKGVDVNIAVMLLAATYENTTDRIILVSSDTDLLPAVKKAREKGKIVEYVGFSHKPSLAMIANCSSSRLLTKNDISQFIKEK